MKLWGGRFKKEENKLMEDFNTSLPVDNRLYFEDITGSIAHVKMLGKCNIIPMADAKSIETGLVSILTDIENNQLSIDGDYEDIHSFVESNLIKRIGDTGKNFILQEAETIKLL